MTRGRGRRHDSGEAQWDPDNEKESTKSYGGCGDTPSEPHPPGLLGSLCLEFFPHGAWVALTGFHLVCVGFV